MATLLPPSPASLISMVPLCARFPLNPSPKCIVCFSIQLRHPICSIKLYMVPNASTAHYPRLRVCARTKAQAVEGADLGNNLSPVTSFLGNMQRIDPLLDTSSNTLNNANDFEKPLQELFDEVKTLISAGNKNDAIDLLRANFEAVKEQLDAGCRSIEEAAILDIIALGYMAVGDLRLVNSMLKLLDEAVDGLEDEEMILDSILVHMGSMYSALGKFEKSMIMYKRALKLIESLYGKNSTSLVTPLLGLANALSSTGITAEAIEKYQSAITILELSRGVETADLVLPLSAIGNLLIHEGKAKDAEYPFTRILNIYKSLYGESDGRVGLALCSLANVKCAQGNTDEAIGLYRQALQIVKGSGYVALDDSIMEKMRIDLAELLHVVGRGDEGRELLEECLIVSEKHKGKEHPSLVTHLINLGTSYSYAKKFAEAERMLRMSLQIMRKTIGPDDPSITFPMLQLAVTFYNLKQDKEAERLALEVLRIREAAFGKESLPVGEALDCLVSIQSRLGEDDEKLLDLLNRVLRIQEKEFGDESEEVMITLKKIVFYLNKLWRRDDKLHVQRRLSALRTKYKQRMQY
ncbi:hypothetical protein Ancab_009064 [Ancistrocladus abbreviatus]